MTDQFHKFNIGGRLYVLPEELLEKYPDCLLYRMIKSDIPKEKIYDYIYINRNPYYFDEILNSMWTGIFNKKEHINEYDFYNFECEYSDLYCEKEQTENDIFIIKKVITYLENKIKNMEQKNGSLFESYEPYKNQYFEYKYSYL